MRLQLVVEAVGNCGAVRDVGSNVGWLTSGDVADDASGYAEVGCGYECGGGGI